tara:strand:+ start:9090 stop:10070 length:981 start_codon:yes stop_codon:yes gene_type:complete
MASFTVNFSANTTGDHYICYRTQGAAPATPFICTTENVTSAGTNSVVIEIPDNIYCDVFIFEGYIIAACEPQTDTTGNGFPDAAVTFSATFPQLTDPCPLYEVECSVVSINRLVFITNPGSGYTIGDPVVFTTANPADTIIAATGVVGNVDGSGGILEVTVTNFGEYTAIPTATAGGSGTGAILGATLDPCDNLLLSTISCNNPAQGSVIPFASLSLGETLYICADTVGIAALDSQYTATDVSVARGGTCNCQTCEQCEVSNTSGKPLNYSYQTCWDESPQSGAIIVYGAQIADGATVNIGCVIKPTVTNLTPTTGSLTLTFTPCP